MCKTENKVAQRWAKTFVGRDNVRHIETSKDSEYISLLQILNLC